MLQFIRVVRSNLFVLSLKCIMHSFEDNGYDWGLASSAAGVWGNRYGHTSVVYNSKMWVMGGTTWTTSTNTKISIKNDVWSSADGVNWDLVTSSASWSARDRHTSVVFSNKMWVLGGTTSSTRHVNEVWYSSDGASWARNTDAGWSGRAGHTAVVFNSKIWVVGGYDGSLGLNDVWSSSNGESWQQVSSSASFYKRWDHASVVFNDRIWVMGGNNRWAVGQPVYKLGDVWWSSDGSKWTWTRHQDWNNEETTRSDHSSIVNGNLMLILGGATTSDRLKDIYSSTDGATWSLVSSNAWPARSGHTTVMFNGLMWVLGGYAFGDVWLNAGSHTL
jgi:leucine-zipper-like transcriptional regulator 1